MKRLEAWITLLSTTALHACSNVGYEDPSSPDIPDPVELTIVTEEPVLADGHSIVELLVKVDPRTPATTVIKIETTSGVLDPSAATGSAESRKIERKNTGTGRIPLTLTVGTAPGDTVITACAGDNCDYDTLKLTPSEPSEIVLTASPATLPADGSSTIDIHAALFAADSYRQVSTGARLRFRACCADASDGKAVDCDTSTFLSLPPQVDLTEGQEVTTKATALASTDGKPRSLWLLAQVWENGQGPVLCSTAEEGAVRDLLPITLTPTAPGN